MSDVDARVKQALHRDTTAMKRLLERILSALREPEQSGKALDVKKLVEDKRKAVAEALSLQSQLEAVRRGPGL